MKYTSRLTAALFPVAIFIAGCSRSEPIPVAAGSSASANIESGREHGHEEPVVNGDKLPEIAEEDKHPEGKGEEQHGAHHDHFEAEGALVTNHGIALFQETQSSGGLSPEQRARIVTRRLNQTAETQGLDPKQIVAIPANGLPTVSFVTSQGKNIVLATIDTQTAGQFGFKSNPGALASWWRDVLRDHAAIIAGSSPLYTTPYSSALQNVYMLCQKEQKGVPTHESFEQALTKLSREERDDLQGLYIQVPKNYRSQAN